MINKPCPSFLFVFFLQRARDMSDRQDDVRSRVKGRGAGDTDYDGRYSGKGAIFSRLDRDSSDGPIQCMMQKVTLLTVSY
jgi:hypothetical protein